MITDVKKLKILYFGSKMEKHRINLEIGKIIELKDNLKINKNKQRIRKIVLTLKVLFSHLSFFP